MKCEDFSRLGDVSGTVLAQSGVRFGYAGANMPTQCAECAALLQELVAAMSADSERQRESWIASGRNLLDLRNQMLAAIANDGPREMSEAHSPRTFEVKRKMAEHEAQTGHSVFKFR